MLSHVTIHIHAQKLSLTIIRGHTDILLRVVHLVDIKFGDLTIYQIDKHFLVDWAKIAYEILSQCLFKKIVLT